MSHYPKAADILRMLGDGGAGQWNCHGAGIEIRLDGRENSGRFGVALWHLIPNGGRKLQQCHVHAHPISIIWSFPYLKLEKAFGSQS